jgi:hypothetical protein
MIAVAAGNELGIDPMHCAILAVGDTRRIAFQTVQRHVSGIVDDLQVASGCSLHQVAGNLSLTVNHDLSASQRANIYADHPFTIGKVKTVMWQSLGMHPGTQTQLIHEVGRRAFQHTRANAAQHIVGRRPFHDHDIDAFRAQQMPEHQPGGPSANDGDLGFHDALSSKSRLTGAYRATANPDMAGAAEYLDNSPENRTATMRRNAQDRLFLLALAHSLLDYPT